MILCINANAAIDKTVLVSPFRLDAIHRPQQVLALPGGKGCNVARALKRLGEQAVVSGWVGGFAGQFIEAGLRQEGIEAAFVHAAGESRTCLSIVDEANGTLTEIYERGEVVPTAQIDELKMWFQANVGKYAAVTLSGSLPAGVAPDFYRDLIEIAQAAGVPALLDASGEALKRGLAAKPMLIKPNKDEFTTLLGRECISLTDFARASREVAAAYETTVIVSLGADGAIVANQDEMFQVTPPGIMLKSAVGSGDCMLAGITYGLTHGMSLAAALKHGVAAGTANALQYGAGIFSIQDFEQIYAGVSLRSL